MPPSLHNIQWAKTSIFHNEGFGLVYLTAKQLFMGYLMLKFD